MARTVDQIIADAITFINQVQPNLSTAVGSLVYDVVIGAPAQEFARLYTELNRVSEIQSLDFPDVMTLDELNSLGDNYGMTRNAGVASQGTMTFRVVNLPSFATNISVPSGTVGTTTATSTAPIVTFTTTQSGLFIVSQAPTYYNPLTGFYEITVPIQAQSIGVGGNVAAGAISTLSSSVPGIFAVTNTVATTGGTDQESNRDYADRIKLKLSGNNLGTINGILSLVLENSSVLSASLVGPGDPEMQRNEFGGSIDIYVLGETPTATTELFTFAPEASRTIILANQPAVVSTGSLAIQGIVSGSPFVFAEGVDYQLVQDPTTLFDGSTQVKNGFKWLATGTLPDTDSQYSVAYTYNALIGDLQAVLDSDINHIVASDILVKEAYQALINVQAAIAVVSGFDPASTVSAAQTNLTAFLTTNQLGGSFSQSQIVAVLENTPGVDEVDLTSLVVQLNNVTVTSQIITIDKTQYTVPNNITLALI